MSKIRKSRLQPALESGLDMRVLSTATLVYIFSETVSILINTRNTEELDEEERYLGNCFVMDAVMDADFRQAAQEIGFSIAALVSVDDLQYMLEENRLLEMGVRRN